MRHAVVLVLAIAAVRVLLRHKPVARAHPRFQAVLAIKRRIARHQAMHDLALVEDHRVAACLPEMSGKCAFCGLQGEFPVDHFMGAPDQFRAVEVFLSGDEGLDNVAGGLGIARQPAVLEAPAGGDASRVGLVLAHILRAAQPVDGAAQVGAVILFGLTCRPGDVLHHQAQVAALPGFVTQRELEEG